MGSLTNPQTRIHGSAADPLARLASGKVLMRNAAGNLLSQGVPMVVALLGMPFLIRGLGTDRFGILTLSWMVLGYFSLFDLGLGRALTRLVAEKLGNHDLDAIPSLVGTGMALMLGLGLAGGAFVASITPWLVETCLQVPAPLQVESLQAFYLMACALPFLIGTAGLRGLLEAYQRVREANIVRTSSSVLILLGPLAVLPWTNNLAVAVGLAFLARLVSFFAHVLICMVTLPTVRAGLSVDKRYLKPLLTYGGWMTAVNVINPLMVQMDRLFIGALVSTAAVAYYTTPYELVTKSWFLSNAVLGVIFPAFATSFVSDRRRTAFLFDRGLRSVALILFPVALVSVALGSEILKGWLGGDFADQGTRVMQWLAVGVLLNGLAHVPSALLQGIGRPDLTFWVHLIELGPYLVVAILLIRGWGIEGAALAWTARTALDLLLYFGVSAWILPECRSALLRTLKALGLGLAVLAILALPFPLAIRIGLSGASAFGFVTLAWLQILQKSDRDVITSFFHSTSNRLTKQSFASQEGA